MNVSPRPFHCRACDKNFMEDTLEHVALKVWIVHIKSLRCPHCGSHKLNWLAGDAYLKAWNQLNPHSKITAAAWKRIKAGEEQRWT